MDQMPTSMSVKNGQLVDPEILGMFFEAPASSPEIEIRVNNI